MTDIIDGSMGQAAMPPASPGMPPQGPPGMPPMGPPPLAQIPQAEPEPPQDFISKSSIEGFRGGIDIDLTKQVKGGVLKDVLSKHIKEVLEQELKNQQERIDKIAKWEKQYMGRRDKKNFPFLKAANVSVPITRSDADAIIVRVWEALFGKNKVWLVKAKTPELMDFARQLEDALDWLQKYIIDLKNKAISPIIQAVVSGTGLLKVVYQDNKRGIYRYATPSESANPQVPKYQLPEAPTQLIKEVANIYKGPNVYPISREDFVISSDARTIQEAYLVGFRTYLRKDELELKGKQKIYYQDAVDKLVKDGQGLSPDEVDKTKQTFANLAGKKIDYTDYVKPYEIWELNLKYEVDQDGEEDEIVVSFHKETGTILRAIYNPVFTGFRPIVALKGYPAAYQFDGQGVAEVLESVQEEIDTMHNQRLDRITQINAPITLVRSGSGIDEFNLTPGKVWTVDDDLDRCLRVIEQRDVIPSSFQEEQLLISLADRAVGITPNVLGQSESERPVAKETFARIGESNKKFIWMFGNDRNAMLDLAWMLIDFMAQYQPVYTYYINDPMTGQLIEQTVNFPTGYFRDGIQISLKVSDEMLDQESRREMNIAKYQLLSDYMTKSNGILQMVLNPMVPPGAKMALLDANQIGVRLVQEIMRDFDTPDAESIVWDFSKSLTPQDLMAPPPMMAGPPPEGEGGPPPEEGPPQA